MQGDGSLAIAVVASQDGHLTLFAKAEDGRASTCRSEPRRHGETEPRVHSLRSSDWPRRRSNFRHPKTCSSLFSTAGGYGVEHHPWSRGAAAAVPQRKNRPAPGLANVGITLDCCVVAGLLGLTVAKQIAAP
jgi:hypothetical protein